MAKDRQFVKEQRHAGRGSPESRSGALISLARWEGSCLIAMNVAVMQLPSLCTYWGDLDWL